MAAPDFVKGASGPSEVYDTSPSGLGMSPAYLAPGASASASAAGSGAKLDYHEFTSNVSVTATTSGTATSIVSASAVTFDGTTMVGIEFHCAGVVRGTTSTIVSLFDGSTELGVLKISRDTTGEQQVWVRRYLTPTAGSHTYSVRAYVDAGTGTVQAGNGGSGVDLPGYIRIAV